MDDRVNELLAKAKRMKAMAESASLPEHQRLLAHIAADYEQLASCWANILGTRRRLVESMRLLGDSYRIRNGTERPAGGPEEDRSELA
jgi:hypothetical protein